MGLVIAMLAQTVPAVQALGQAIFLPMILIGGVGVPQSALPPWAGVVAGYLPGRYAVAALDSCVFGDGLIPARFSLIALLVIGVSACVAGANLFRWDAGQHIAGKQWRWIAIALAAWAAVGLAAQLQPNVKIEPIAAADYQSITDAQIQSITYDELQDDSGMVTPFIHSPDDVSPDIRQWMADFQTRLSTWPPGNEADPVQRTRNLLSLAAAADLDRFDYEGEVPYVAFQQVKSQIPKDQLEKILTWIILRPGEGKVLTSAPELGITGDATESDVRDRTSQYARKFLGRLLGKLG
jgi:ABC-2 type transport system permease protein